jgi:GNAT superfamily N-acetyltransferase
MDEDLIAAYKKECLKKGYVRETDPDIIDFIHPGDHYCNFGYAFIVFGDWEDGIMLRHLYVDPKYRNEGFATSLINLVISIAKLEKKPIYLWCNHKNTLAFRLYEMLGFYETQWDEVDPDFKYMKRDA